MKYKTFDHFNCSLAQTLTVIGERWSLLILRDAFFGIKRFGDFQRNLDISKNILTDRLNQFVGEGIMEKQRSNENAHPDYVLTEKGLALQPILLSMTHWGDKYKSSTGGDRPVFVDRETNLPIRPMAVISADGRILKPRDIKAT